jgi:hypothetical protein
VSGSFVEHATRQRGPRPRQPGQYDVRPLVFWTIGTFREHGSILPWSGAPRSPGPRCARPRTHLLRSWVNKLNTASVTLLLTAPRRSP